MGRIVNYNINFVINYLIIIIIIYLFGKKKKGRKII